MADIERTIIYTPSAHLRENAPFSQAVVVNGTMYISGNVGIDPSTKQLAPGGIRAETEQTLKNIGEILKAAGGSFKNVVKTTVLLTDMNDYAAVNEVYANFFSESKPARAAYQVVCLPAKAAKIEIEAVAVLGDIVEGKL